MACAESFQICVRDIIINVRAPALTRFKPIRRM
jgi:hypothetical protein